MSGMSGRGPGRRTARRTSACARGWLRWRASSSRSRPEPTQPSPQWQERAYWLDRLHIDLNALMERPGADQVPRVLRACDPPSDRLRAGARTLKRRPRSRMTQPVSVVIPVKDGERYLEELLAAVAREGPDETLVIDSGSRDARRRSPAPPARSCSRSRPREFGHGRTRNLGASDAAAS